MGETNFTAYVNDTHGGLVKSQDNVVIRRLLIPRIVESGAV